MSAVWAFDNISCSLPHLPPHPLNSPHPARPLHSSFDLPTPPIPSWLQRRASDSLRISTACGAVARNSNLPIWRIFSRLAGRCRGGEQAQPLPKLGNKSFWMFLAGFVGRCSIVPAAVLIRWTGEMNVPTFGTHLFPWCSLSEVLEKQHVATKMIRLLRRYRLSSSLLRSKNEIGTLGRPNRFGDRSHSGC